MRPYTVYSHGSEEQIIGALKEAEAVIKPAELCRRYGISEQTFYRWKAKFGGWRSARPSGRRTG